MSDMSSISAPSAVARPAMLCPPPLMHSEQVVLARELHAGDHVGHAEAARDERGPPVDHRVPDGARLLVAGVAGCNHRPAKTRLQRVNRLARQIEFAAIPREHVHTTSGRRTLDCGSGQCSTESWRAQTHPGDCALRQSRARPAATSASCTWRARSSTIASVPAISTKASTPKRRDGRVNHERRASIATTSSRWPIAMWTPR